MLLSVHPIHNGAHHFDPCTPGQQKTLQSPHMALLNNRCRSLSPRLHLPFTLLSSHLTSPSAMATSRPTLLFPTLLLLCILLPEFPSKVAADGSPECPYPCLPPPTSVTNYPPPPPPSLPPPPPQPYTPGYNPTPTTPSNVPYYPAPGFVYPAPPPPPNKIMPYFPYYYRTAPNSAPVKKSSLGLPMAVLHLFLLGVLLS